MTEITGTNKQNVRNKIEAIHNYLELLGNMRIAEAEFEEAAPARRGAVKKRLVKARVIAACTEQLYRDQMEIYYNTYNETNIYTLEDYVAHTGLVSTYSLSVGETLYMILLAGILGFMIVGSVLYFSACSPATQHHQTTALIHQSRGLQ